MPRKKAKEKKVAAAAAASQPATAASSQPTVTETTSVARSVKSSVPTAMSQKLRACLVDALPESVFVAGVLDILLGYAVLSRTLLFVDGRRLYELSAESVASPPALLYDLDAVPNNCLLGAISGQINPEHAPPKSTSLRCRAACAVPEHASFFAVYEYWTDGGGVYSNWGVLAIIDYSALAFGGAVTARAQRTTQSYGKCFWLPGPQRLAITCGSEHSVQLYHVNPLTTATVKAKPKAESKTGSEAEALASPALPLIVPDCWYDFPKDTPPSVSSVTIIEDGWAILFSAMGGKQQVFTLVAVHRNPNTKAGAGNPTESRHFIRNGQTDTSSIQTIRRWSYSGCYEGFNQLPVVYLPSARSVVASISPPYAASNYCGRELRTWQIFDSPAHVPAATATGADTKSSPLPPVPVVDSIPLSIPAQYIDSPFYELPRLMSLDEKSFGYVHPFWFRAYAVDGARFDAALSSKHAKPMLEIPKEEMASTLGSIVKNAREFVGFPSRTPSAAAPPGFVERTEYSFVPGSGTLYQVFPVAGTPSVLVSIVLSADRKQLDIELRAFPVTTAAPKSTAAFHSVPFDTVREHFCLLVAICSAVIDYQ